MPNRRFWICFSIFILLVVWLWLWPYTGEGDSMLHYWNLRQSFHEPKFGLTSWARPLYVLIMVFPAVGGVFAVRCFTALLSTIMVWQTMRLADDLEIPNATLAGPLLIFQPLVFGLASDTMTEMPMALGVVIALRLWYARKYAFSCLMVSFLPLLRPEGFFIAPVWGLFILFLPTGEGYPPIWRRFCYGLLMATGMVCLTLVCYAVTGDVLYFKHSWSWAMSAPQYLPHSFWHHFKLWPGYCGLILFPLFLLGVRPSIKRKMALPWAIWGTVFMTHTVLFWRGMFGSIGLMRILACTAPITALIMLYGWNYLASRQFYLRLRPRMQQALPVAVMLLAATVAMLYYADDDLHYRCFLARDAAAYIRQHDLNTKAPRFFAGDPMVLAALDYQFPPGQWLENGFERQEQLRLISELPIGSVGAWDNQQGQMWHSVKLDDFDSLGYSTVFSSKRRVRDYNTNDWMFPFWAYNIDIEFVVVVKERMPGEVKAADPAPRP